MKKHFLLIIALAGCAAVSFAQQTFPVLTVKGESKIFQMPDIVEVNITISTLDKEYQVSVQKNLQQLNQLKKALKAAKVISLKIEDVSQQVNEERNYAAGKSFVAGYRANYQLVLQLSSTPDATSKLLNVLKQSDVKMNYHAAFKLSPALLKDTKSKLIEQAVDDAVSKAEIIAKASYNELGKIYKIEYGVSHEGIKHLTYMTEKSEERASFEQAFTDPKPIELTDFVTITWQLK